VDALCPRGAALVESETSFVQGLVTFTTLGVYDLQSVRVVCVLAAK